VFVGTSDVTQAGNIYIVGELGFSHAHTSTIVKADDLP
jgi:hypothetical protein